MPYCMSWRHEPNWSMDWNPQPLVSITTTLTVTTAAGTVRLSAAVQVAVAQHEEEVGKLECIQRMTLHVSLPVARLVSVVDPDGGPGARPHPLSKFGHGSFECLCNWGSCNTPVFHKLPGGGFGLTTDGAPAFQESWIRRWVLALCVYYNPTPQCISKIVHQYKLRWSQGKNWVDIFRSTPPRRRDIL